MTLKLHINASTGLVEVEGDEKSVLQIYDDIKEYVKERLRNISAVAEINGEVDAVEAREPLPADSGEKKSRRIVRRAGPSCAKRISALSEQGFFTSAKTSEEIKTGLAKDGHTYATNQVGAALTDMYKRGILRRTKADGKWAYVKP